ncbi:hypothetical protein EB118_11270 [bacterium]|nr:hypothetical protein [bacterium]
MSKKHKCESKEMNLNILTAKEFEQSIITIMRDKKPISMIDAIVLYCENKNIEIETAAALVSSRMKSRIEAEATDLNMIVRKTRLPIDEDGSY